MFDVLTGEKGASVLRMLEQHLGPTVFGMESATTSRRMPMAMQRPRISGSLGQASKHDVPALTNERIFSPGYPVLAERGIIIDPHAAATSLHLRRRYVDVLVTIRLHNTLADPNPVRIDTGQARKPGVCYWAIGKPYPLPQDWTSILANEGGHGFYRVRYSAELVGLAYRCEACNARSGRAI